MDALDDPERGVGTLQLLAQDREADVVHPAAAVGLRDRRAQEALLGHLRSNRLRGEASPLVPFADVGQDLGLGEGPGGARWTSLFSSVRVKSTMGRMLARGDPRSKAPRAGEPTPAAMAARPRDRRTLAPMETSPRNLTPVLGRYFQREWSHGEGHRLFDTDGRRISTSPTASRSPRSATPIRG